MKWIGPIVLAVVGVLALIVGILYLTNPIHSLPSLIGGKHIRGHYIHRGEALVVAAVAALGVAAYWASRIRKSALGFGSGGAPEVGGASPATTDSLLGIPSSDPGASPKP